VEEVVGQGGPVQGEDVVRLEKGVDAELPVHLEAGRHLGEEPVVLEVELAQLRAQPGQFGLGVDGGPARRADEQQAEALGHGQGDEPRGFPVELVEGILGQGLADEAAMDVVAPGVVRAGERPARTAPAFRHPPAAVTTDVEEGARRAVLPPHQQQRHPRRHGGDVLPDRRQVGAEPHHQRAGAEEPLPFGRQTGVVGVDGGRIAVEPLGHVGGAGLAGLEEAPQQLHLGVMAHGRQIRAVLSSAQA
jgi:hypothetical protein